MKQKCELWLVIDDDGDYEVGCDQGQAMENFASNIGGSGPVRVIKITAAVAPPKVEEIEIDVRDEAGETIETEAA